MKTLAWVAVGGAAVTAVGLLLLKKRTEVSVPSVPPVSYGETKKVALAVPSGWRRATSAEVSALPELASYASSLMNAPGFTSMTYGTLTPFTASDGNTYATWIEQHFHTPGGAAKPWGLHHGVTILAQAGAPAVLADEWPGVR